MQKHTEWTYRPKYTEARISKELADKEQALTETVTELLRASTNGKDAKTIVFERFFQMLDDFKRMRSGEEHFDWVIDFNLHTFEWFLYLIQYDLFSEEERKKRMATRKEDA